TIPIVFLAFVNKNFIMVYNQPKWLDQFFKMIGLIVLTALTISCSSKLDAGNIDLENWKNDRNGCKGLRIKDLKELEKIKNTFLEANNQELIMTFGRPDRVLLLDKSQSFFFLTSTLGHPKLKAEHFCQFFLTFVQQQG